MFFESTCKFSFTSAEYRFPLYGWLPNQLRYRLRIATEAPHHEQLRLGEVNQEVLDPLAGRIHLEPFRNDRLESSCADLGILGGLPLLLKDDRFRGGASEGDLALGAFPTLRPLSPGRRPVPPRPRRRERLWWWPSAGAADTLVPGSGWTTASLVVMVAVPPHPGAAYDRARLAASPRAGPNGERTMNFCHFSKLQEAFSLKRGWILRAPGTKTIRPGFLSRRPARTRPLSPATSLLLRSSWWASG